MNTVRAVVSANVFLFATMGLGLASPIVQAADPDDIVFLIRIAKSEPSFLVDRWNAFGAVRAITQSSVN